MNFLPEDDPRRQVWEQAQSPIEKYLAFALFALIGCKAVSGPFDRSRLPQLAELAGDNSACFLFAQHLPHRDFPTGLCYKNARFVSSGRLAREGFAVIKFPDRPPIDRRTSCLEPVAGSAHDIYDKRSMRKHGDPL